jgi:hypothetical protein
MELYPGKQLDLDVSSCLQGNHEYGGSKTDHHRGSPVPHPCQDSVNQPHGESKGQNHLRQMSGAHDSIMTVNDLFSANFLRYKAGTAPNWARDGRGFQR